MPGINLLISKCEASGAWEKLIESSIANSMVTLPHITCHHERITPQIHSYITTHAAYRVSTQQVGDWQILYENQHEAFVPAGITQLLKYIGESPQSAESLQQLRKKHLDGYPGAFFLAAINRKTQKFVFANDSLARLPVYIHHSQSTFYWGEMFPW